MAGTEVEREVDNDDDAQHRLDNRRASKELLEAIKGRNGRYKKEKGGKRLMTWVQRNERLYYTPAHGARGGGPQDL